MRRPRSAWVVEPRRRRRRRRRILIYIEMNLQFPRRKVLSDGRRNSNVGGGVHEEREEGLHQQPQGQLW